VIKLMIDHPCSPIWHETFTLVADESWNMRWFAHVIDDNAQSFLHPCSSAALFDVITRCSNFDSYRQKIISW
jgi:hypothetical protein